MDVHLPLYALSLVFDVVHYSKLFCLLVRKNLLLEPIDGIAPSLRPLVRFSGPFRVTNDLHTIYMNLKHHHSFVTRLSCHCVPGELKSQTKYQLIL